MFLAIATPACGNDVLNDRCPALEKRQDMILREVILLSAIGTPVFIRNQDGLPLSRRECDQRTLLQRTSPLDLDSAFLWILFSPTLLSV